MLPIGSVSDAASGIGFIAAAIAVCGFLGQVGPASKRQEDEEVRAATVVGGLFGLVAPAVVIIVEMMR